MQLDMNQWRQTFFQEAEEHVEEIELGLTRLKANIADRDALDSIFRAVHSLKGDSGSLGFEAVQQLAHNLETLLDLMREDGNILTGEAFNLLILAFDQIEPLLVAARTDECSPSGLAEIEAELIRLAQEAKLAAEAGSSGSTVKADGAPPIKHSACKERELAGLDFGLFEELPYERSSEVSHQLDSETNAGSGLAQAIDSASAKPHAQVADFVADHEIVSEFIAEAHEHLQTAEENLLALDSDPTNSESLNAIYRAFHTIKGVSSFLAMEATRELAHQAESLLNLARESRLQLQGDALEVVFASVDGLKRQLDIAQRWLARGSGPLESDSQLPCLLLAIEDVAAGRKVSEMPRRDGDSVEVSEATPAAGANKATGNSGAAAANSNTARGEVHVKESIKVDRDRLDKLINVIGELVISESMAQQEFAQLLAIHGGDSQSLTQLSKTVRDLQELSLSLRMVPVGSVFQKMARIVRDLGRKLGKQITFETEGEETELDKTVVDQIGDPLMHMVRNAADHGLETPEERIAAGKPAAGKIRLRAYHQGGNIYVEIRDDGRGLNRAAIVSKAIQRGLISEHDTLSDQEICNLIFAPGFSTAKQVTDVSGRGVGMDVVRRNVEALQGTVNVSSVEGEGSTVLIRLPLTLAILDGLSIRAGNDVYIVPILSVVESFKPRPCDVKTIAGKCEVVVVRGEVVPVLRLHHLLKIPNYVPDGDTSRSLVVIVEDREKKFALMVDELLGQSQVVIKNLETNFQKVDGVAGATILGNGRVAMILDIYGLVSLAAQSQPQQSSTAISMDDPQVELF